MTVDPSTLDLTVEGWCPHYSLVPKDPVKNVDFRAELIRLGQSSERYAAELRQMVAEDVLFAFNAFFFCFEPRPSEEGLRSGKDANAGKILPFITWPHQDWPIVVMDRCLGFRDLGIEKSRGEGASWICVLLLLRRWLSEEMFAAGMVSRGLNEADNPKNPGSMGWKVDWELKMLPSFLMPAEGFDRNLSEHAWTNRSNGSTITAHSATGDVGTSDRKTVFVMDELAKFPTNQDQHAMNSTQHVTHSRFLVSTPKGHDNVYAEAMHDEESNLVKVVIDWKDNPTRNRGLYRIVDRDAVEVDVGKYGRVRPEYRRELPEVWKKLQRRGFDLLDGPRSEWFDNECLRSNATPKSIAQELCRDYGGSEDRFFERATLDYVLTNHVREPYSRCRIGYDPETLEPSVEWAEEGEDAPIRLWLRVDPVTGRPERAPYGIGCDISAGTGGDHTSNSSIVVFNRWTGEQVLEFADHRTRPAKLARLAMAIGHWLRDENGQPALLNWETNGPNGATFSQEVQDYHYTNPRHREVQHEGTAKRTSKIGSHNSDGGESLMSRLRTAMIEDKSIVRSALIVAECRNFIMLDGKMIHSKAKYSKSEAGKGRAHGDVAMGAAYAWQTVSRRMLGEGKLVPLAPPGSFAWRREQREKAKKAAGRQWDFKPIGW